MCAFAEQLEFARGGSGCVRPSSLIAGDDGAPHSWGAIAAADRITGGCASLPSADLSELAGRKRSLEEVSFVEACKRQRLLQVARSGAGESGQQDPVLLALHRAAYLQHIAGDAAGARSLYEDALQRLPPIDVEPRMAAEVLSGLGSACAALGDYAAAREHSEIACRLFARLLPEDHPTLQSLIGRLYGLAAAAAAAAATDVEGA